MEGYKARWYANLTRKSMSEFRTLARRVADQLPRGARVLEVAPGPGYFAIELAKLGKYLVWGLDISRTFVDIARGNAREAGIIVDFRHGNAAAMPLKDESFDFVVCRAAFKNFAEPVRALEEMHRVLRKGGRGLIIDLRRDAPMESINRAVNGMSLGVVSSVVTKLTSGTRSARTGLRYTRCSVIAQMLQDVNYALRVLRKSAGFTAAAVLTLALGIGASTAIFSIVNAVLLQPLPYPDADRIFALNTVWKEKGHTTPRLSGGDLIDIQSKTQVFDAVGLYTGGEIGLQIGNRGEFSTVYYVSPDLPRAFSVKADYGRLLEQSDADRAALVSRGFATRMFGGGPAALGQPISVEHRSYQIAGVLPSSFEFPRKAEVWLAAPPERLWNQNRTSYSYYVVAKLRAGVSAEQARAQLDAVGARLAATFPDSNGGKGFAITPLREQLVHRVGATLWILMAAVSLVLLISCANVANLMLARGTGRSREIALRAALGAGRWRIVRQLMVESVILAVAAGILGVLFAAGGTAALLRFAPDNLPRLAEVGVDRFVLLFAGAVSLLSTIVFGLVPAWQTSRIDLREALQ
ncbi:MAG: methyltransferase domain-containing protein, partial [Bryobacteraceae bacterium]